MATLFITELEAPPLSNGGVLAVAKLPSVAQQTVAVGAGSLQSNAFNALTKLVRLHTDVVCSVNIGANPTASATTMRLAANSTEYFAVNPGDKVAVITNS